MTDEEIQKAANVAIRTDHCEYNSFVAGAKWAREEAAKEKDYLVGIIKILLKIEHLSFCNGCLKQNAELIADFNRACREVAKEIWGGDEKKR